MVYLEETHSQSKETWEPVLQLSSSFLIACGGFLEASARTEIRPENVRSPMINVRASFAVIHESDPSEPIWAHPTLYRAIRVFVVFEPIRAGPGIYTVVVVI